MPEYRCRVDEVKDFKMEDLERYLTRYAVKHLLVRHELPNNVHYHFWMETEKADVTIRMNITKYMPYCKGNGGHSIQVCDTDRKDTYLQYLFNRKKQNRAFFVSESGVPNWEHYKQLADESTADYIEKKKSTFSKFDCIETLLALNVEHNVDDMFDHIMELTKKHRVVFSANAIRDIIIAVGHHSGDQKTRAYARESVLRFFVPYRT